MYGTDEQFNEDLDDGPQRHGDPPVSDAVIDDKQLPQTTHHVSVRLGSI